MTTNTSMAQSLGVTYKGILCYIWPANYQANTLAPFSTKQNQVGEKKDVEGLELIQEPGSFYVSMKLN